MVQLMKKAAGLESLRHDPFPPLGRSRLDHHVGGAPDVRGEFRMLRHPSRATSLPEASTTFGFTSISSAFEVVALG